MRPSDGDGGQSDGKAPWSSPRGNALRVHGRRGASATQAGSQRGPTRQSRRRRSYNLFTETSTTSEKRCSRSGVRAGEWARVRRFGNGLHRALHNRHPQAQRLVLLQDFVGYPSEVWGRSSDNGNRIGGRNELRFNAASGIPAVAGGRKEATLELHFPETNDAEWRYWPSATLIRAVGCYAFRIEGEDFVEWVTFIARK